MGFREDDEYWNTKYAEASCHAHPDAEMIYDSFFGDWWCIDCEYDDDNEKAYKNG